MENQNEALSPIEKAAGMSPEDQKNLEIAKAKGDRNRIAQALKEGTLCCIPDESGYADTDAARNIVTGTKYRGASMLLLKQFAKENNYPTAEYVSFESLSLMNDKLNLGGTDRISLPKGSKGFTITYSKETENPETGEKTFSPEHIRLFNVACLRNAEKVKEFEVIQKHERQEFVKAQLASQGKNFAPRPSENSTEEIVCSSVKPEEYLGQYFAAVSLGAKFKATKEQSEEFAKNAVDFLYEKSRENHINPFNLSILSRNANAYCKNFLKSARQEQNVSKEKAVLNQKTAKPKSQKKEVDSYEMGM